MRRNRTFDPGHLWALAVTVALHAPLAAWWWAGPERREAAADADPLLVTWIDPPIPMVVPQIEPEDIADPTPRSAQPRSDPRTKDGQRTAPDPATPSPARAPQPPSAALLEQAAAQARAGPGHDFRRNPLAVRPAVEPPPPERFRMREPMSPARVVARIGLLFGGPGYETDPCPRIRRNLGHLRTAGADNELLQEELRRHRQFCEG